MSLVTVFLLLGFCPLRNTLFRPPGPVPAYAKITSGKECRTAVSQAVPYAHPSWALTAAFAFSFTGQLRAVREPGLPIQGVLSIRSLPIYLLNRALLI